MDSSHKVKLCGLQCEEDVRGAIDAGASYVGFVFFEKSPRHVSVEAARELALMVPPGIAKVALVVDADDATLDQLTGRVPLDMLQLHGAETLNRVRQIKARYGLPVMKAVGVADQGDLDALEAYSQVADQILVDAKPPEDSDLPGGNGLAFDWRLIAGKDWTLPWMLAGGLTADTVADAIRLTGARQVDVSSGIESAPGRKDMKMMADFIKAARGRDI